MAHLTSFSARSPRRFTVGAVVAAYLATAMGCSESHDADAGNDAGLRCAFTTATTTVEIDSEASRCFVDALEFTDGPCVSDADCTLVDPSIDCPTTHTHFGRCQRAIAADHLDAWNTALTDAAAIVCAEAPSDFAGSCDGISMSAACVAGRCQTGE